MHLQFFSSYMSFAHGHLSVWDVTPPKWLNIELRLRSFSVFVMRSQFHVRMNLSVLTITVFLCQTCQKTFSVCSFSFLMEDSYIRKFTGFS